MFINICTLKDTQTHRHTCTGFVCMRWGFWCVLRVCHVGQYVDYAQLCSFLPARMDNNHASYRSAFCAWSVCITSDALPLQRSRYPKCDVETGTTRQQAGESLRYAMATRQHTSICVRWVIGVFFIIYSARADNATMFVLHKYAGGMCGCGWCCDSNDKH